MASLTVHPMEIRCTEARPVLAALPSRRAAKFILSNYIGRVHMWWPILHLPSLRNGYDKIFTEPNRCDAFQKFVVFITLALGSFEGRKTMDRAMPPDIFTPSDYFATSSRFYAEMRSRRTLQALQATLLICLWLMRTPTASASEDLWQLSRFAISSAQAMGCHRNHPRRDIDASERELRSRIWWCSYALERTIAVALGRTLSLRNQAIDTPYPRNNADDALTDEEAKYASAFKSMGIIPAVHLFRLTRILGDTLESVYIARPRVRPSLSLKATRQVSEDIRTELRRWEQEIDLYTPIGSRENKELRIRHSLASLLLNRPSPSFPLPAQENMQACLSASSTAITLWTELLDEKELKITWNLFHDVFISGLSWLYCGWRTTSMDDETIIANARSCLRILEHTCNEAGYSRRHLGLFDKLTRITIATRQLRQEAPNMSSMTESNVPMDVDLDGSLDQLLSNLDWSYGRQDNEATDPWMSAFISDIEKLHQEISRQPQ
ncbi:hypothetical protein L228DRAFT_242637 [Xylona heveae TC161]|uniref:Xylanolytic transcriptional activator regulatory domain-containing protein n=1 Tax=Xylona heveae (strain CBS 132557 / TC161) TaxID=1328760 RepID=A0A165JGG5_XYLHT|nr:hypothetical protein L228DRAFT_242637 [Xylona heveae TC161]KZF26204.1 hypothetical protein L228DRAFT_242637 [Xylona heveae TC161]